MNGLWRFRLTHGQIQKGIFARSTAEAIGLRASSSESANPPQNAFDGNPETRWCATGATFPQWLQIDLGQELPISAINTLWERDTETYRCRVEGSLDTRNWTQLTDTSVAERGVGNENPIGPDTQEVFDLVQKLDPTRPAFASGAGPWDVKGQQFRDEHYPGPDAVQHYIDVESSQAPAVFTEHPHTFYSRESRTMILESRTSGRKRCSRHGTFSGSSPKFSARSSGNGRIKASRTDTPIIPPNSGLVRTICDRRTIRASSPPIVSRRRSGGSSRTHTAPLS